MEDSTARWDDVLPLLVADRPGNLNEFTASKIAHELRIKSGKDVSQEDIAQTLREAVVLLLRDNASYKVDAVTNEVVYLLPGPDVRGKVEAALRARSRGDAIKYLWSKRIFPGILAAFKLFIGIFLIISLFLVVLALIALLAAANGRSNSSSRSFNLNRSFGRIWFPFRFWWWPCPVQVGGGGIAAGATGRAALVHPANNDGMSFAEAVFSFIFGDGAGETQEDAQVAALSSFIQANEGKRLKALHFIPFLISPPILPSVKLEDLRVDEGFMAAIVWRFRGTPVSSDRGKLEYEFPPLPRKAQSGRSQIFREKRIVFSLASDAQQKLAFALGIANLLTLALVWVRLNDPEQIEIAVSRGGFLAGGALAVVNWMLPFLVGYAVLFLAIPAARLVYINKRNKQIDAANDQREQWRRWITDRASQV